MADFEIIQRVRAGNTKAYEELVIKYEKKIYCMAYGMMRNEQDALDITQEVFLKAFMYIGNFRNDSEYFTYLYRIAQNECKDFFLRRKKRQTDSLYREDGSPIEVVDQSMSAAEIAEAAALKAAMYEELNKLEDDFKQTMILRCIYNQTYEQIARYMQVDIGTVKSRIFRSREKIRKGLLERNIL